MHIPFILNKKDIFFCEQKRCSTNNYGHFILPDIFENKRAPMPGPGKYNLNHDFTLVRNPAYSFVRAARSIDLNRNPFLGVPTHSNPNTPGPASYYASDYRLINHHKSILPKSFSKSNRFT